MMDVSRAQDVGLSPRSAEDEPPENEYDGPTFSEIDPSGRYGRFEDVLGRGACKVVYKAFDTQEGTEVAWNQVRISDLMCTKDVNKEDRDRLFAEIRVLKALKHKNIMSFYDSWYDPKTLTVNFITELFTSGTLRQYRKRHKHVDAEVLKRWAWQILCGLVYLHGHNPPIIHRDLKCDNIFINGSDGVVKIGDLGLATMLRSRTAPQSVLGTPEFMAPELYEEDYDDRVDVYAFGMALLELATLEYPYAECSNAAQIYRKVMLGVRPAALQKITDRHLAEFINTCIAPRNQRPLARQLLKHPYFDSIRQTLLPSKSELSLAAAAAAGEAMPPLTLTGKEDGAAQPTSSKGSEGGGGFGSGIGSGAPSVTSSSGPSRTVSGMSPEALAAAATTFGDKSGSDGASLRSNPSNGSELASAFAAVGVDSSGTGESGPAAYASSRRGSRTTSPAPSPPLSPTSPTPSGGGNSDNLEGDGEGSVVAHSGECHCAATQRCFQVNGKYREVREKRILSLRLRIKERDGAQRTVEFEFDTNTDTAVSVASEMVSDLELSPEDADTIVIAMGKEISALTQSLEPKASTSLQAVGAALQQGLVENALLQANEGSGVLPQAAVPPVFQERLPSVSEAGEPAAPAEGEEGQVPSPAPQLPRDGSTLSVNSEESAASVHSAHSAMSIRSSPAQLTATAESSLPVQRSVSPPQPGSAPGPHHMMRTLSVDRTFRHVALPPGREGGTPVPLDRNLSGALSPRSGLLSPEGERRDIADKRSLRNLFENLQEVAKERESAATPPPGMRPPLPPSGNGHQGNGTSVVLVQGRTSPPVPTWGNGIAALALPPDQAVVTVEDLGKSSASDLGAEVSGLIGARKPPVKDKEALRKQAADAMRAVEMRSLTLLEGSMGGPKILRGTPMAANKQHGSCSSLASSSGTAELVLPAKDQPEASAAPLAMATVEETRLE